MNPARVRWLSVQKQHRIGRNHFRSLQVPSSGCACFGGSHSGPLTSPTATVFWLWLVQRTCMHPSIDNASASRCIHREMYRCTQRFVCRMSLRYAMVSQIAVLSSGSLLCLWPEVCGELSSCDFWRQRRHQFDDVESGHTRLFIYSITRIFSVAVQDLE